MIDAKLDQKLDEKLEPMKKNMAAKAEDMAEFFHNKWVKMDETNGRVRAIEDHLDMPHSKENSSHFQKELVRFIIPDAGHFFNLFITTRILGRPESTQRILSWAFRYVID